MWAIKGKNEKYSWIAGIVEQKEEARRYKAQIGEASPDGTDFVLIPLHRIQFPLVLMYAGHDVRILCQSVAHRVLKQEARKGLERRGKPWIVCVVDQPYTHPPNANAMPFRHWYMHTETEYQKFNKEGVKVLGLTRSKTIAT